MRAKQLGTGLVAISYAMTALFALQAGAASRSMIGSILIENPSAGFELAPGIYGKPVGQQVGGNFYPPTADVPQVSVAGTTAGTSVGRTITVPANRLNRSGFAYNVYPAFSNVGQVSKSFMTIQNAATFANGAALGTSG